MKTGKQKLIEIAESIQQTPETEIIHLSYLTEIGYHMYDLNKIIPSIKLNPGNKQNLRSCIIVMARLLEAIESEEQESIPPPETEPGNNS